MRNIFRLACLVGCALLPAMLFAQGKADDARKHLVRGAMAIEMAKSPEDLSAAAEEFKKAAEIDPGMPAAWFNLGSVQAKSGKSKEAIDSYTRYLALSPRAADAGKIRDEIIKLEYRLEQEDKFKALSGQWMSDRGYLAFITANIDSMVVYFPLLHIANAYDRTFDDSSSVVSAGFSKRRIDLQQKGARFVGIFEDGASRPGGKCVTPAQKSVVTASAEKDRIVLRWPWTRFQVIEKFGALFDTEVYCLDVSPSGTLNVEIVLKKLPPGGIARNGPGLQAGDWLVSVDGVALESLSPFERGMKVRGQVGATVQLMVNRLTEPEGIFSSAKYIAVPVTATMTEVPIDPPVYQAWVNYF